VYKPLMIGWYRHFLFRWYRCRYRCKQGNKLSSIFEINLDQHQ